MHGLRPKRRVPLIIGVDFHLYLHIALYQHVPRFVCSCKYSCMRRYVDVSMRSCFSHVIGKTLLLGIREGGPGLLQGLIDMHSQCVHAFEPNPTPLRQASPPLPKILIISDVGGVVVQYQQTVTVAQCFFTRCNSRGVFLFGVIY